MLITGGTGSFGKEFVKECLSKDVRQVRVYSRDELKQAQMQEEINDARVEYLCGDVRDYPRLLTAMKGVDIVIHAAAMKRIEKCERDPQEAVKTNILGTINVANACLQENVQSAVLISTDKAVYPINLYGSTKLVAEKVWTQSNTYRGLHHPTKFSVVRYGNVLGSRGSVLHLFKHQLEKGVLKVTDERMTRFFITLQEAVDLVQLAIEFMQGGEIFVPSLKAASIYHLATLCAGNIPVEITSQRGGEKLHESLITKEEKDRLVSYENFSVINPELTTWPYQRWTSEIRTFYESSETAPRYTDDELTNLIRTI
jgi:UDP-N-acetylglucosamine 4,6-dehydratase